jgi:glycosyltransferase involved in cell wall biosynthesis
MKICHVTTAHPALDVRIFHKECASLALAGHLVTLVVSGAGESFDLQGVRVIMVPVPHRGRLGRILRAPARLAEEVRRLAPQVVHFHDPEFLLAVNGLQRLGIKAVYDVHEDLPRQILSKYWIPAGFRKGLSWFIERFENRKARSCAAIVAATPLIAERFRKLNPMVVEVCNYPIPAEFAPTNPVRTEPPHVCYIGAISYIRGFSEILRAIEPVSVVLDLAGHLESEEMRIQMKELIDQGKIVFHGLIDRPQVAEIMSSASAGLVLFHPEPNHIDALPTKLFEYMFAGIPVIVSDFPLWKSIIEENHCGMCVNPLDVEAIIEAIRFMAEYPEEAQEMGRNGRRLALEYYSWDSEKEKLLQLYTLLEAKSERL